MVKILEGKISAEGFRFAIVMSRFNDFITSKLEEGALDALRRHDAEAFRLERNAEPPSGPMPPEPDDLGDNQCV